MKTVVAVLILSTVAVCCSGQFQWPCPFGCALTTCGTFGCSVCLPGYYVYMSKGHAGCVRSCPTGTYPNAANWCSGCAMAGCTDCSSKNTCTKCSLGYELQGTKCIAEEK